MAITATLGSIALVTTGTTVTPTLPSHSVDSILLVAGAKNAASNLTIDGGWTAVSLSSGTNPRNNANLSTALWWKRAASSSETAPTVTSSTSATGSDGLYATVLVLDGALASDTPFDGARAQLNPLNSTEITSGSVDTTGTNRLLLHISLHDDAVGIASGSPPSGWDLTGTDSAGNHRIMVIEKLQPAAGSTSDPVLFTASTSAYFRTFALGIAPAPTPTTQTITANASGSSAFQAGPSIFVSLTALGTASLTTSSALLRTLIGEAFTTVSLVRAPMKVVASTAIGTATALAEELGELFEVVLSATASGMASFFRTSEAVLSTAATGTGSLARKASKTLTVIVDKTVSLTPQTVQGGIAKVIGRTVNRITVRSRADKEF
jgi:hypothetical protein